MRKLAAAFCAVLLAGCQSLQVAPVGPADPCDPALPITTCGGGSGQKGGR